MHNRTSAKFNQSFQATEHDLRIIEENLVLGGYRDKSKMFRDSLEKMNKQLKAQGITA